MTGSGVGQGKVKRAIRRDETISALQEKLRSAAPIMAPGAERFALLDFPAYANVGDSLIWLGALDYFHTTFALSPAYAGPIADYDPKALAKAVPEGPIYLSGGGNFGNIWPKFQAFRHRVLADFPDRRIVQLPQTLHFDDPAALEEARRAIAAHKHFQLLVRDQPSFELATRTFDCEVALVPDMAFCLGPLSLDIRPAYDIVYLLRADRERMASRGAIPENPNVKTSVVDWIAPHEALGLSERLEHRWVREMVKRGAGGLALPGLRRRALRRLEFGAALLASGRYVVTDRLHGHILSLLLGLNHSVIDNANGKVREFQKLWTTTYPAASLAPNVEAASDRALVTLAHDRL